MKNYNSFLFRRNSDFKISFTFFCTSLYKLPSFCFLSSPFPYLPAITSFANSSILFVLSSDIGVEGVTYVAYPEIEETYLDWQEGNWAQSYLAYTPSLKSVKTWDAALDGYKGIFIVLGQSPKGEEPSDVNDIVRRNDVSLVEFERFYRPYERTYFTVALLEKV